jgi:hypothetical protein
VAKKKWYSYFVVTDEATAASPEASAPAAPRRVADIVPGATADADDATDLDATIVPDLSVVYTSAKIVPPAHGYTVLKVAEMIESEHIRSLPDEVKRKSVLVALDAAGVKVQEIVEDAVRRDRALDAYERALEKHLESVRTQAAADSARVEEEIQQRLAELRARAAANRETVEREEREFAAWQARKRAEEETIARAVGYFVVENPITATGAPARKGDADVRQA